MRACHPCICLQIADSPVLTVQPHGAKLAKSVPIKDRQIWIPVVCSPLKRCILYTSIGVWIHYVDFESALVCTPGEGGPPVRGPSTGLTEPAVGA